MHNVGVITSELQVANHRVAGCLVEQLRLGTFDGVMVAGFGVGHHDRTFRLLLSDTRRQLVDTTEQHVALCTHVFNRLHCYFPSGAPRFAPRAYIRPAWAGTCAHWPRVPSRTL